MTSKENVLNVYPEAEIKVLTSKERDGRREPLKIYLVSISSDNPDFKLKRWHKKMYTIAVASTLDMAWDNAWEKIQQQMLRKFENEC